MSWDWAYVVKILPDLLLGVWYTVLVTLASAAIALTGGLLIAVFQDTTNAAGKAIVRFFLELFRGVPILVLLYFGYYVLPEIRISLPAFGLGVGSRERSGRKREVHGEGHL